MVVLMEYPRVTLKRKGAEEPGLFMCPGDGDGFPLSGRATKIRRLVSADHHHGVPAVASVGTGGDVIMGEAPSPAVADEEGVGVVTTRPAPGGGASASSASGGSGRGLPCAPVPSGSVTCCARRTAGRYGRCCPAPKKRATTWT